MAALEDEFGDIIRKARTGLGISAEKLANIVEIPAERLKAFEAYEVRPTEVEISTLAAVLSLKATALAEIVSGWTPAPVDFSSFPDVFIEHIEVPYGHYSSNCYILGCRKTSEAAIVDPGGTVDEIAARLNKRGLKPVVVLITHGDRDHTGGLADVRRQLRVTYVVAHKKESIEGIEALPDGAEIAVGELRVKLIHTPGHTPGSACYAAGSVCFTGDMLFAGSLGGATRYTGGYQDILTSAQKIMALPGSTVLLPGHGPATTVEEERSHNPFLA